MRSCKQIFDKGLKPYYKCSVCLKPFFRFCFLKTHAFKQRYRAFALTPFSYKFFNACKIFIPIIDFKIVFIPIPKHQAKLQRVSNAY
ncbi:hypothetical protein [Helicobacter pylori]|uniref:C2H2-type domain-containing protein n=1 Tax=Helicobacter pylori HP260AFii TaxID=1159077 RepID=A0ABC9SAS0_HELPX|nr:hypothetical protein [Helicobacter pylori]EMH17411.1 hypothetical protein HMPREF1416_01391 [Helicobacter pylori GAM260ASi]EMH30413.1 hypothetical protein HMPREF1422_00699 [Helicobacter pylori GAM268Bii]EMH61719.1 hypothetical protein HMPREF1448_01577 [Helicobacter pylori HP260AFi]EMH67560.1 hypothetical protein HMPREF1449_00476 [Helicobacter pylori HP260AFii]EMH68243.1 hypothetical protein HMPREF1450_00596 [Helicobacter pylori HP260ASii]